MNNAKALAILGDKLTVCIMLLEWRRSEEHTSELQSPVPISYAVFCLKKKNIGKHSFRVQVRVKRKATTQSRDAISTVGLNLTILR